MKIKIKIKGDSNSLEVSFYGTNKKLTETFTRRNVEKSLSDIEKDPKLILQSNGVVFFDMNNSQLGNGANKNKLFIEETQVTDLREIYDYIN